MPEAATELSSFKPGENVPFERVASIVAPGNTLDEVEKARLRLAGAHLVERLRADLSPREAESHESEIRALGAEALLKFLPEEGKC